MLAKEMLQNGLALLEKGHCRHHYATDGVESVPIISKAATCFCSLGALYRVSEYGNQRDLAWQALNKAIEENHKQMSITTFNDTHSWPEIKAVWEKAINDL